MNDIDRIKQAMATSKAKRTNSTIVSVNVVNKAREAIAEADAVTALADTKLKEVQAIVRHQASEALKANTDALAKARTQGIESETAMLDTLRTSIIDSTITAIRKLKGVTVNV